MKSNRLTNRQLLVAQIGLEAVSKGTGAGLYEAGRITILPGSQTPATVLKPLLVVLLQSSIAACGLAATPQPPPNISYAAANMDSAIESRIDPAVTAGIEHGDMSGCVVLIGRREGVVFERAYGNRCVEPHNEPMTT